MSAGRDSITFGDFMGVRPCSSEGLSTRGVVADTGHSVVQEQDPNVARDVAHATVGADVLAEEDDSDDDMPQLEPAHQEDREERGSSSNDILQALGAGREEVTSIGSSRGARLESTTFPWPRETQGVSTVQYILAYFMRGRRSPPSISLVGFNPADRVFGGEHPELSMSTFRSPSKN